MTSAVDKHSALGSFFCFAVACVLHGVAMSQADVQRPLRLMVQSGSYVYPSDDVRFSPDGRLMAVGGWQDKGIRVWDVASARELWNFGSLLPEDLPGRSSVRFLPFAFAPDGKSLVYGTDQGIYEMDLVTGAAKRRLDLKNVAGFCFLPDGTLVVSENGSDAPLQVLTWPEGKFVRNIGTNKDEPYSQQYTQLLPSPDGAHLLAREYDSRLSVFELASGRKEFDKRFDSRVDSVFWSADDNVCIELSDSLRTPVGVAGNRMPAHLEKWSIETDNKVWEVTPDPSAYYLGSGAGLANHRLALFTNSVPTARQSQGRLWLIEDDLTSAKVLSSSPVSDTVFSASLMPDGRLLVNAKDVIDPPKTTVLQSYSGATSRFGELAFLDGGYLDLENAVWDPRSGRPQGGLAIDHSANDIYLFADHLGDRPPTKQWLWDSRTGATRKLAFPNGATGIKLRGDAKQVLFFTPSGQIGVLDVGSGLTKLLPKPKALPYWNVSYAAWSPDGGSIYAPIDHQYDPSGDTTGRVVVWDLKTGSASIRPSGPAATRRIGSDGIFDPTSGKVLRSFNLFSIPEEDYRNPTLAEYLQPVFNGHEVLRLRLPRSPDGTYTGSTIAAIDVDRARVSRTFEDVPPNGLQAGLNDIQVTKDDRTLFLAFNGRPSPYIPAKKQRSIDAWDIATGKLKSSTPVSDGETFVGAADASGSALWTWKDQTLRKISVGSAAQLESHNTKGHPLRFDPNGSRVLVLTADGFHILKADGTGDVKLACDSLDDDSDLHFLLTIRFSPDGHYIALTFNGVTRILNCENGSAVATYPSSENWTPLVDFSQDSKLAFISSARDHFDVRDLATQNVRQIKNEGDDPIFVAPDNRTFLATGGVLGVRQRDASSGKVINQIGFSVKAFAFEKHLSRAVTIPFLTATDTGAKPQLFDVKTGAHIATLASKGMPFLIAGPNRNGEVVVLSAGPESLQSTFGTPRPSEMAPELFSVANGARVAEYAGCLGSPNNLCLSDRGLYVAAGTVEGTICLWTSPSAKPTTFPFGQPITNIAFGMQDSILACTLADGSSHIISVAKQKELCRVYTFDDSNWAVIDSEGRYDASNAGDIPDMHWVKGLTPIALNQLKERFYDPGLLPKLLGFSKEPVRDIPDLSAIHLPPDTSVQAAADGHSVHVTVTPRDNGGIGEVRAFLNGVLIQTSKPPTLTSEWQFDIDMTTPDVERRLMPTTEDSGDVNKLEIVATDASGILTSAPCSTTGIAGLAAAGIAPPKIYAIVVGISDYAGDRLDLHYAAADGLAFSKALQRGSTTLVGVGRTQITTLLAGSGQTGQRPTKPNVLEAFKKIASEAKSTDVLIVYLAGHGADRAAGQSGYYFLTSEAGMSDVAQDPLASSYSISSDELADLMSQVPANKQALILDTCCSGAAADDLTKPREVTSDVRRSWERLKDRSGVFVLAGCAADGPSYEASNVGHGLLTYSLLEPLDQVSPSVLRRGPGGDFFVDTERWFSYAEDRVPQLVAELGLGGIQKPENKARAGARSFDVGELKEADKGKLELPVPRPVILLDRFENRERLDPLDVTNLIEHKLSDPRVNSVAYWRDVRSFPGAYRLVGNYEVTGDNVAIEGYLQHFKLGQREPQELDKISLHGKASSLQSIVQSLVARAVSDCTANSTRGTKK